jgi:altronate hydrolase
MYERLSEDMDVNAGRIIRGEATVDQIGQEIYDLVLDVAAGRETASESMGHAEFILTYKSFEPIGPACLPA